MALAQLIQVSALQAQLDHPNLIIFDCRFALTDELYGKNAYEQAHIPHAIFIDLEKDLSSPVIKGVTSRHPLPDATQLSHKLAQCGLNNDSQVVIYDDGPTAYATKLWWTLLWLGKRDNVFILDGGFNAWKKHQAPTSKEIPQKNVGNFEGLADHQLNITASELASMLDDPQLTLLDARSLPRFRGEVEPMDPVAGHIPGAICADMTKNLDPEGHFLPARQLHARFASIINDKPTDKIISYCGSGVTATHNLFALCLAGYPLAQIYAGSWSEWITNTKRPIATGD